MPIYEYECEKCRSTFEVMQAISAKPLKKHSENGCNGKVQRLVSASGFILKGSGWYVNDYPSDSRKQGWEKEQNQAKPPATETSAAKTDSSAKKEPSKAPPADKTPAKKPAAKNPYSGRKSKKTKATK